MKAIVMRVNPCFVSGVVNCDVLDELKVPARHSTASFAAIGSTVSANRMLHRL